MLKAEQSRLLFELSRLKQDQIRLNFLIANGLVAEKLREQTRIKIDRLIEKEKQKDVPNGHNNFTNATKGKKHHGSGRYQGGGKFLQCGVLEA